MYNITLQHMYNVLMSTWSSVYLPI